MTRAISYSRRGLTASVYEAPCGRVVAELNGTRITFARAARAICVARRWVCRVPVAMDGVS